MRRRPKGPLRQCLKAGCLHCRQSIDQNGGEDFNHLPVAVVGLGQLAPHPLLLEHLPDRLVGPLGMAVRLALAMHCRLRFQGGWLVGL
jgi:hypothetical protein